jgi:hypothetical protein
VRLKIGVVAAASAALVAAGCGGGGGGGSTTDTGGAAVAPGNAAAYISVDSNLDSAGWTKAKALLDRFPGKTKVIASLRSSLEQQGLDWETDVKPALGNELDIVWLDFQNDGENYVGVTKPKDAAKFDALLAKGSTPTVHEQVDGWTVFAEDEKLLDRFRVARDDSGSLDDDSGFSDPYGALPSDSLARAWVRGGALQTTLERMAGSGTTADAIKNQVGTIDSLAAAVTPSSDGISIAANATGDLKLGGENYHAELPSSLPGGAIFYLSLDGVGSRINDLIDTYGSSIPNFDQQRAQLELVLGYSLKEVLGLLDGEDAIVVYPAEGGGTPAVLLVAKVSDETKAQTILNRLATLGAASGAIDIKPIQIGSVDAKEITRSNGTPVYAAVFDGNLVVTNSRTTIEKMQGSGPTLADDAAYKAAVDAADVPDETTGFVYADVKEALEYAFDYAENQGETVEQVVKDNTAPLRGLLLYGTKDGGTATFSGFLGIG